MENGLPILCPVDERGVLTEEAGEFMGVYYKDCDRVVVERLQEEGALLHVSDYSHSYPHAERDGQPVIFRATEQWFVSIDHKDLREKMLKAIKHVKWVPANGQSRIEAMVSGRPDWCISRQRPWGVGIPVFYGKQTRKPILDPEVIERVAKMIEEEGSDGWFFKPAEEILPAGYVHPETGETEFEKETDVLDVWFDSGATSLCVLEGNVEPAWKEPWPSDLYFEGSDQHRGWFNSSLVIAMATRGQAPYRQVVTHGWVLDEKMLKMSKRLGNVIDPEDVCKRFGADILRYWVASTDYTNDVPCSENLLKQFGDSYRRVRNTLRFLLSNLQDFAADESVPLLEIDSWVMEQVDLLSADCVKAFDDYDYTKVITSIHNFCVQQLSSFYLDAIKDRMYCDGKDWDTRKSGQAACFYVLLQLVRLLAPILPHTAEEVYARIPMEGKLESVHMELFNAPDEDRLAQIEANDLEKRFAAMLEVRAGAFAAFEQWKVENEVKDSQDVIAKITEEGELYTILQEFNDDLANFFKMSAVELSEGPSSVGFRKSEYLKCERCRLRRPDVDMVEGVPLSKRDRQVLGI
jgi:isoleucyl-tRNA synthetase